MVKCNISYQKACLINWNHETYHNKQQFIKSLTKKNIFKVPLIFLFLLLFKNVLTKFCFPYIFWIPFEWFY